jgi:hypothetical protein
VERKAHAKESEENVEVGECLGETEIARVTLAIADRSNMEMRGDSRNHHPWVGAGYQDTFTLDVEEENNTRKEDGRKNVDHNPGHDRHPDSVKVYRHIPTIVIIQQVSILVIGVKLYRCGVRNSPESNPLRAIAQYVGLLVTSYTAVLVLVLVIQTYGRWQRLNCPPQ